ncbi:MAG: serine hydrolase [Legionella sp.]|uniref:D-alanyl-D-alanine carboxypeptidase family protein n=1 Tax=Legionella sp. TaxID=459 RepID=UPI002844609A|nr:serine hydrolase [Legionella sp.]
MRKIKIFALIITTLLAAPSAAFALAMPQTLGLQMPQSANGLAQMFGISAQAYVVADVNSGQVLINKNADLAWPPASLTKLVTALVVLDTKPNFEKTVTMTLQDQVAGACTSGGACIKSKAGVKFTVDGLFHALLMPSANNAANALARSTGLSASAFAARMNQKAAELGATNSHFNEPTGLDPNNVITADDYTKIIPAAFSNPYMQQIAGLSKYVLHSTNNSRYNQTIKNTDQLLADSGVQILGAKTGYLNESKYNFAALVRTGGETLAVVVLGENHLYTAFDETKQLASLAQTAKTLALIPNFPGTVLGASTTTPYLSFNN